MNNCVLSHLSQVPGSTHYSMVFYFVTKELVPGSLLQRFVDGDDEFRNSRFKLLPSVLQVVFLNPAGFMDMCNEFSLTKLLSILNHAGFMDYAPKCRKHSMFIGKSS
jgi:hypothetical protein